MIFPLPKQVAVLSTRVKEKNMVEQKIAFIGLGKMGSLMSRNLVKRGYVVTVYNRTKDKTKPLAEVGAKVATAPKEAAMGADVIISMISDDSVLEAVSYGPGGAFEGATSGAVYIDMSTVSPAASSALLVA